MKKVHLICNAHIDPIWQWDWQEGASAAISTFQSAVNLAEEFDYIFCHNEVILYQYIEEYAPNLFEKIRELVKAGKWHIMGGWYLQPDCTMPSGESFTRQILTGHKYFKEKFGVVPTTAINFDPFGHTRGLVQILSKCGQNSYLMMRPLGHELGLESNQFMWEGFDGSKIKVNRTSAYNSPLGNSLSKIKGDIDSMPQDVIASLWGVGNHGGGPSRKDLQDINEYIKTALDEGVEIVHSTPEDFIAEINPTYTFSKSLYLCMPGCYVTMSKLKRLHIELENQLYYAEKISSAASLNGLMEYPKEEILSITKDLMTSEFHDVLPGTTIKSGEDNGIKILNHGLIDAEKVITKAFFALTKNELPAKDGEYPAFVFNPHPYEYETNVECEFMLTDQNWRNDVSSFISVYDSDGNLVTSQKIKEESCLNLDWRKRIIFAAKLKPSSLNRFSVRVEYKEKIDTDYNQFTYKDDCKYVEIDKNTGLLKSLCINGKEYIKDAFLPVMFDDNIDPWAMGGDQLKKLGNNPQSFNLCKNTGSIFSNLKSVDVVENGDIFLGVMAFFEKNDSKVAIEYRIYKNQPYVDVNATVFWQDSDKLLRLAIPLNVKGKLIGQTAFGTDDLFTDGRENVSHRFIAVKDNEDCLAVFNNSTYGSMFENDTLYISLLRGAGYCVHPLPGRELIPNNCFIKRIDHCEHKYSFRIAVAKESELERLATEFNQKPYTLNAFPVLSEYVEKDDAKQLVIDNKDIALVTMKKSVDSNDYIIRLMNNSENATKAIISINNEKIELAFGKYEVKTVIYDGSFKESDELLI